MHPLTPVSLPHNSSHTPSWLFSRCHVSLSTRATVLHNRPKHAYRAVSLQGSTLHCHAPKSLRRPASLRAQSCPSLCRGRFSAASTDCKGDRQRFAQ